MNQKDEKVEKFIKAHERTDLPTLALLLSKRKELPRQYILDQVNGRQKASDKFPFLLKVDDYRFPSIRAVAQASSETAALYKASLLSNKTERIADLSGGMGIDSFFLAQRSAHLDYIELDPALFEISEKNFNKLKANNIHCHRMDASHFLNATKEDYDLIYLDPDRRKEGKRMIRIEDCEPRLIDLLPRLLEKSKSVLVKFSPMLDLKSAFEKIQHLSEVHILSIANECKELLFLISRETSGEPHIKTVDIRGKKSEVFEYYPSEEEQASVEFSEPLEYLYEANSSIMKSGAFKLVAEKFGLKKIANNTHLYTSESPRHDFPGRKLKLKAIAASASELCTKAMIVNRNSGLTVEQIKKKFKIREGGTDFLYAFRLANGKRRFALAENLEV